MSKKLIYDLSKLDDDTRLQIMLGSWGKGFFFDWFTRFPTRLGGISQDAKTVKGEEKGVLTLIAYLSAAKESGVNLCPFHEIAKCANACLKSAGRGKFPTVQMSRLQRTLFMLQYPEEFKKLTYKEIRRLERAAKRKNLIPAVRLNGTSDIYWENELPELFTDFPHIQFYDYTKAPNRKVPEKYHLTFSYSGVLGYQKVVRKALKNNFNMAVVFDSIKNIPKTFMGKQVVSGDDSDIRFMDPPNSVIALKAKGSAIYDKTGFVVRPNRTLN
jgi:hypothetical protein